MSFNAFITVLKHTNVLLIIQQDTSGQQAKSACGNEKDIFRKMPAMYYTHFFNIKLG